MTDFEVIIIGAGPAGLTLACRLGQAGIRVLVLDHLKQSKTALRDDNRTAALLRPAVDVLKQVGVNPEKLDGTAPLRHLRLIDVPVDPHGTLERVDFSADEIHEPYFALNIKNAPLHQALLARAEKLPNVKIMSPVTLDALTNGSAHLTLHTSAGNFTTALLVGADGKQSRVRSLSGIGVDLTDYEQTAITCAVAHKKPHHDTSIEFHRPGGPFTLVPLQGHVSSVVWMERTVDATAILALPAKEFEQRLHRETHNELGPVQVVTLPQFWPITLMNPHSLIAPRTALVAEAAHAIPPSGAQGLNLSLRDTEDLARLVIDAHETGIDIGSSPVLKAYQSRRTRDITPRLRAVDGLNRIILTDNPHLRRLRRHALRVTSGIPPLRHALMRFGWAGA